MHRTADALIPTAFVVAGAVFWVVQGAGYVADLAATLPNVTLGLATPVALVG